MSLAVEALPSLTRRQAARHGFQHLVRRFARNRLALAGSIAFVLIFLTALLAPWVAPASPIKTDFAAYLQPPSPRHPMGTDELGRDVLSRIIFGARASLEAGMISVGLAIAAGLPVGIVAGFYRGRLDDVLMRLTDAMLSFPQLILALAVAAVLGPGLAKAMIAIAVVFMPSLRAA